MVAGAIWTPFQAVYFTIIPARHVPGSQPSIVADYAGIDGYIPARYTPTTTLPTATYNPSVGSPGKSG